MDILTIKTRPDIVLINRTKRRTDLLELSCSFEKNVEKANILKTQKYLVLKNRLRISWMEHIFGAIRNWILGPS